MDGGCDTDECRCIYVICVHHLERWFCLCRINKMSDIWVVCVSYEMEWKVLRFGVREERTK